MDYSNVNKQHEFTAVSLYFIFLKMYAEMEEIERIKIRYTEFYVSFIVIKNKIKIAFNEVEQ